MGGLRAGSRRKAGRVDGTRVFDSLHGSTSNHARVVKRRATPGVQKSCAAKSDVSQLAVCAVRARGHCAGAAGRRPQAQGRETTAAVAP